MRRGFEGSGPSALFPPGKTVTVSGLRGKTPLYKFLEMIRGFQLEDDQETSVLEVAVPEKDFTMYKRYVVVLASESEAQRLVRKLHRTPIVTAISDHCMTASVIY